MRDHIEEQQTAAVRAAMDHLPNAYDCTKRLKSCGYQVRRHVNRRPPWHVFETDKGVVAIQRHPGGRWEIRRMQEETKGDEP